MCLQSCSWSHWSLDCMLVILRNTANQEQRNECLDHEIEHGDAKTPSLPAANSPSFIRLKSNILSLRCIRLHSKNSSWTFLPSVESRFISWYFDFNFCSELLYITASRRQRCSYHLCPVSVPVIKLRNLPRIFPECDTSVTRQFTKHNQFFILQNKSP